MEEISPAREERLRQVLDCVSRAGDEGASAQDVAKCLNLKVTPHLRDLLDQLVGLNWIRRADGVVQTGRGLRNGARYFIIPEP